MKKILFTLAALIIIFSASVSAQDGHEYAPILEKSVNYKNWTLNNAVTNQPPRCVL